MSVTIIIPAYNEEKTITQIIEKSKKYGDVIVVDDASIDKTYELAKKSGVNVITNKINRGLGYSIRKGIKQALKTKTEIIITIDADGQHNSEDIPLFIEKIKQGYEFVLGQRDLSKYPFIKKIGNFFLDITTNFISGTKLKDTQSGFRAFDRKSLEKFHLKLNRYEIAAEIIFEVGKFNLKTYNIKIDSPIYVKGVGITDGIKSFLFILEKYKNNIKNKFS